MRPLKIFLATFGLALALAAPASASSIFYIHANNIWAANPDGSGQRAITADGTSAAPYLGVASAKQGSAPPLAFLRYSGSSFVYGTIRPDGTGAAANPASATLPMPGFTQGDNHQLSMDAAGDRVAWTRASNIGSGETFSPHSIGVDGSSPLEVSRGTYTLTSTFGDPAGQSLLFDDAVGIDYSDANNDGALWPHAPAPCTAGTAGYGLVRQAPQPHGSSTSGPAPIAYYCENTLDLVFPALSPNGQTIAAVATGNPPGPGRIVTIPIGSAASGSSESPLTYVTPPGSLGQRPDFAPDGSAIVFEDGASHGIDSVPAAGGQPAAVVGDAISPAWSPYNLPPAGGAGGPGSGAGSGHAPAIRAARLMKKRVRAKKGIALQVTLSAAGTLRVQVARRVVKLKGHRRRTSYRSVGTVSFHAKAGKHRYTIKKVKHRRLKPGTYRLTLYTVSGKAQSARHKLTVTVTR